MRKIVDAAITTVAAKRFEAYRMGDLIEKAYLSQRREPSDRAKKSFAPSGIGYGSGACPRQWFYSFEGGVIREDEPDAVGIANMAYGTEAHARIQELFEKADILIEAEREINTIGQEGVPPIRGYVDLIVDWQGEEVVGEIKTTSQESYVSKKSKNAPAGYHLLQLLIYMKALELNKGFLLYENKNTQEMLIIPVVWNVANSKLADDAWKWMTNVYGNWEAGTKPTRPYKSEKSVVCKTCPFKTHCWSDSEDGTVTLPTLEVPK